jgi:ring-1,2-phenylacetyl-CoA epoxidase subunit PaaD
MVVATGDIARVWQWLEDVPDPEIPVLSVVDLGIVRAVAWEGSAAEPLLRVTLTPTYSGCPATAVIEGDIVRALEARGVPRVAVDVRLAPAWTTDWLTPAGHEKLRAYGIAPPSAKAPAAGPALRRAPAERVTCPRCASERVELTSRFGSTPCKALYRCNACREPFDYFKCH